MIQPQVARGKCVSTVAAFCWKKWKEMPRRCCTKNLLAIALVARRLLQLPVIIFINICPQIFSSYYLGCSRKKMKVQHKLEMERVHFQSKSCISAVHPICFKRRSFYFEEEQSSFLSWVAIFIFLLHLKERLVVFVEKYVTSI